MSAAEHPLLAALRPVADALGGEVVKLEDMKEGDVPLQWDGETVAGFRIHPMHNALGRLVSAVELELGARLSDLDRAQKQAAVRLLDDKGAFLLRKSIEDVADLLGVSRITIYNYLSTVREGK